MTDMTRRRRGARQWGVRLFRAGVLLAILVLIRFHAGGSAAPGNAITLDDARRLYPSAFVLRPGDHLTTVLAEDESPLGFIVKTLPSSEGIIGYAGPADVLIALDGNGSVTNTSLRWSGDTEEHLAAIRKSSDFFSAFHGWTFSNENNANAIDAVSGATLSSYAIIESVALRLGGTVPSLKFPNPIDLEAVQRIFPEAHALAVPEDEPSRLSVLNEQQTPLGTLLRTSPDADAIVGYQGPSDALLGLQSDGRLQGITLDATYDNQRYADYVREDKYFTKRHQGKTLDEIANLDVDRVWADGVSGATMTSGAVMEGVILRARNAIAPPVTLAPQKRGLQIRPRDSATLLAILLACGIAFTRLRAHPWARVGLYCYLILILGLWVGDMVSLAVLGGWAKGSVPLKSAPGLVALVAAAFVLPWSTGKPVYCQHLCPHGAAQSLLFNMVPGRLRMPRRGHRLLSLLPLLTLAGGLLILILGFPISLSALEPFDAWIFGIGGAATIAIALVGLVASAFIPQAYCKYGCPTGVLLDYARTRRNDTALNRRDAVAVGLLSIVLVLSLIERI